MNLERWLSYVVLGQNPPMRRRRERRGPARDVRYRAFIRTHACAACGSTCGIECAHTGPHGLGMKAPDTDSIPLCWWCHWGKNDSLHRVGPDLFQRIEGLKIHAVIHEMQSEWKEINERRRES